MQKIVGWIPNMDEGEFYLSELCFEDGFIQTINILPDSGSMRGSSYPYILPGLVDAHVHIESSMLLPTEFARHVARWGTMATVSDPHEIGNVLGEAGVEFMIQNARDACIRIYFTVPSCVPATMLETSGAILGSEVTRKLLQKEPIVALGEMMNFPGVVNQDQEVIRKIEAAKSLNLPIDGHAPCLTGKMLKSYVAAGISTDHEAVDLNEALQKIEMGMKILIREGSAAKNFEALCSLIDSHTDSVMLCSDDLHPDNLVKGHINLLVKRGLQKGLNIFNLIKVWSHNPVNHYKLDLGLLRVGDPADFIVVDNMQHFNIIESFMKGQKLNAVCSNRSYSGPRPNKFLSRKITKEDISLVGEDGLYHCIGAIDGSLMTEKRKVLLSSENGMVRSDPLNDVIKVVVVNRYEDAPAAVAWIQGFGLKYGAIASTVAHDSHNIVVVGVDDDSIIKAIETLMEHGGGICAVTEHSTDLLSLPIAGIISDLDANTVAAAYELIDRKAKEMGSQLNAPLMTLSFMALLVIPSIKLGDKGLFDGDAFKFIEVKVRSEDG